jgi:hypothetical protein
VLCIINLFSIYKNGVVKWLSLVLAIRSMH